MSNYNVRAKKLSKDQIEVRRAHIDLRNAMWACAESGGFCYLKPAEMIELLKLVELRKIGREVADGLWEISEKLGDGNM